MKCSIQLSVKNKENIEIMEMKKLKGKRVVPDYNVFKPP